MWVNFTDRFYPTSPPAGATVMALRAACNSLFGTEVIRDINWLDEMGLKGEAYYKGRNGETITMIRPEFPEFCWNSQTEMQGSVRKAGEGARTMTDERKYFTEMAIRPDGQCAILVRVDNNHTKTSQKRFTVTEFAEWMGWKPGNGQLQPTGFVPDTTPVEIDARAKVEIRHIKAALSVGALAPDNPPMPIEVTPEMVNPVEPPDEKRKPGRPKSR